jgi:hypothetical protein
MIITKQRDGTFGLEYATEKQRNYFKRIWDNLHPAPPPSVENPGFKPSLRGRGTGGFKAAN